MGSSNKGANRVPATTDNKPAMEAQVETKAPETNNTPATNTETRVSATVLEVAAGAVKAMEFNGVVSTEKNDQMEAIRGFVRSKILRQFGVNEVAGLEVTTGKLFMNGFSTTLKLPKLKVNAAGVPTESLTEYYKRSTPDIAKWLMLSIHNSKSTIEDILAIR